MSDLAQNFASFVEQSGAAEQFCEQRDMDTGECMTRVMDTVGPEQQAAEQPDELPQPPEEGIPELEEAPVEDGVQEISSIVADCMGTTVLGFSRPNEHACMRAFEKQERRIEDLERELA